MRISAPLLPAGDLQSLADKVCYDREHLHRQPEERRTCIPAWDDAVDSFLRREHSQWHTARAPALVAQVLSVMASILSALVLIMIEQLVAFHAVLIALCACCSSCILGGGALGCSALYRET